MVGQLKRILWSVVVVTLFSSVAYAQDPCEQARAHVRGCQDEICSSAENPSDCHTALEDILVEVATSDVEQCELGLSLLAITPCDEFVMLALQQLWNARLMEAEVTVFSIGNVVQMFFLLNHRYPEALSELAQDLGGGPMIDEVPFDPWSNDFHYQLRDNTFSLFSAGPDGVVGSEDDIVFDNELQ